MKFRQEKDSLGMVKVPEEKFYGASTQRAVHNFPISSLRFSRAFIEVFSVVKECCARVNGELKLLDPKVAKAISKACQAIAQGQYDDHFVVDVFQTGSGTSTNMNFNEVIATLSGKELKRKVHPNDEVNKGQSSNDVFPTVIHVCAVHLIQNRLLPALQQLEKVLVDKAKEFKSIVKVGRTHLQDATPLLLGQEFSGYEAQIRKGIERIEKALPSLFELAIGGTAVGTGVNTHPEFGKRVSEELKKKYQLPFVEASNHFEAQAAKDACLEMSGVLRTLAVSLSKIANDLRWLSCGPRAGLSELILPEVQPGSSIMPGKINPVIPEAVLQVCAKVIGNDSTITWAAASGNFELNTMMPVLAFCLLESIEILSSATQVFGEKCIEGLKANQERIDFLLENNLMLATPLALVVGYDKAAELAKTAWREKKSIREVALEQLSLTEKELDKILEPKTMVRPKK